ncbi:MAG: vWA domain-containing protein, partial [Candidatus Methylomirabilales bacterium]
SPEVKRSFAFPFTYQAGGVLKATIDSHDDLSVDDTAYAILPPPASIKVLLVSSGNLFLEKALASDPQLEVERLRPEGDLDPRGYDVVIFDGLAPKLLPSGGYLLINTLSKNVPLEVLGKVEEPQILDWDRAHPVMRYLDLSKVLIQEAMKVRPLGGGRVLLESSLTPLIYTFEEKGLKVIFLGFDLYKSDLPLRTAFPIFISNALRWLSLSHQEARLGVKGGQTLTLEFPPEASEAVVLDPEGKAHRIPLKGGKLSFGETRKAGVYTVKVQEEERKVAVNLFDEEESKIFQRAKPPKEMETQGEVRFRAGYEFWPFFALLALGVLFLEGLLFLRSTGFTPPIVFRGLLLFLILFAFLRPQVPYRSDRLNILFLLDTSDSIPFEKRLSTFASLKEAARFMGQEDTAGLLLFGSEPSLVVPPERRFHLPKRLPPLPPSRATDIEKAIHLALAALPREGGRRIVLLSDGNENRGSALEAAEAARAEGVEIYSFPLRQTFEGEVVVEEMILPQEVKEGEAFILKIVAWSAKEGGAHLSLFRDGSFVGSQKVRLKPGKNVFAYQQVLEEPGFHLYQVRLEAEGDSIEENNRA